MPENGQNQELSGKALTIGRIQQMKGQGLSNNQIIETLQRDGFSSSQIFEALNQSSIQPTTPGPAQFTPQPLNSPQPSAYSMNQPLPDAPAPSFGAPGGSMRAPMGAPMGAPSQPMGMGGPSDEELIEAIIDEKWNDLLQDINKIIAWKDRTAQQITSLETQFKDLKDQYEKLHQAVIGKVGEYDQHILQVGAEVKAMEKVFSKVLPAFTENVAELSRISATFRSGSKK